MAEYVDEEGRWIAQAAGLVDDAGSLGICKRHILICNEIIHKYLSLKSRILIVRKSNMNESDV
jgi:hypothetical protein